MCGYVGGAGKQNPSLFEAGVFQVRVEKLGQGKQRYGQDEDEVGGG